MTDKKTPGQIAYELDCEAEPNYAHGTFRKRPAWDQLGMMGRASWEKNPTPRRLKCPACGDVKPYRMATSRYTHAPICSDCSTKEALEGPFWAGAAAAWAETLAKTVRAQ